MAVVRKRASRVCGLFLAACSFLFLVGCGRESAEREAVPAEEPARPAVTKPAVTRPGDKEVIARTKKAVDRGIRYLFKSRNKDGSYGRKPCVGITGLCVRAMAESHRKYREADGPQMSAAVEYILANVQKNGGIFNPNQGLENYRTCVAISALFALENPKYKPIIKKASNFVAGLQCSEETGYDETKHPAAYGGIGYGGDQRPDISNVSFAVEALKQSGLPEDSPVWDKVRKFISRCQHSTEGEGNDQAWATDEVGPGGGFVYMPGSSKAGMVKLLDGREVPKPYGSVTYMGVLSLIYANVGKDDPRVKSAYQWMRENFTVEENPEMGDYGLYYYYVLLAKCLYTLGDRYVVTPDGVKHDWAKELSAKLIELQREDGSWVNKTDIWWEGDPALVTAYSILALNYCIKPLR